MMPGKQHLHREPVAMGNSSNQDFVRGGLHAPVRPAQRLVARGDGLVQLPVKLRSTTIVEAGPAKWHSHDLLFSVPRGASGYGRESESAGGKMPLNPFDLQANPPLDREDCRHIAT
jgi:hypothetical protein